MKHLPDESGVCACGFGRFGTGLVMICLFSMSITEQMQSDSTDQNSNESIKISIRFLSNEIRADGLDIKIFNRVCTAQINCTISEKTGTLIPELKSKILKTASIYEKQNNDKDFKPYVPSNLRD